MPIYEYECLENGHQFEALQKITDKPLKSCKICNSPVRRLISNTSFILKGGGWYAENYNKSAAGNQNSSSKPAEKTDSEKPKDPKTTTSPKNDSTPKKNPPKP